MSNSLQLQFQGTISQILVQNETVPTARGSPPDANQINGTFKTLDLFSSPIVWTSSVPTTLNNATINSLKQIPGATVNTSAVFEITAGRQFSNNTGNPNLNVSLFSGEQNSFNLETRFDMPTINDIGSSDPATNIQYCSSTQCPQYNLTNFNYNISAVELIPWNRCRAISCQNHPANGLSFKFTVTVNLNITCDSNNFESGFCLTYCTNSTSNLTNCLPLYDQLCLESNGTDGQAFIFTSQGCRSFFTDFMATVEGPERGQLDNDFTKICAVKFPGDTLSAYRLADDTDKDICGCHLNPKIYQELQESLEKDFPGSSFAGEITQCLFPDCANSNFPTSKIGKRCQIPACFNLESVNNQGQFTGTINFTQTCQDLKQGGSAHTPGNNGTPPPQKPKSWLEKHWVWLVVGISVAIILIIIIVLLSNSGSKKKKKDISEYQF